MIGLETEDFKNIMNIPFALIFASFLIIVITSNATDKNSLSALISGYIGLIFGLILFIIFNLLYDKTMPGMYLFPLFYTVTIIALLVYYLYANFDKIASGEVPSYYYNYLTLSTIFLAAQMFLISTSVYNKVQGYSTKLFSDTFFSLLVLFAVVNALIIITVGVILKFYSTQG